MRKRRKKKHSMTYDSTKYVHGRTNGSTVRRKTGKGVCVSELKEIPTTYFVPFGGRTTAACSGNSM